MRDKLTICIKRYPFSLIITILIGYLSLFTPPKVELEQVALSDKWAHIIMYLILEMSVLIEYKRSHSQQRLYSYILLFLLPCAYGGFMELIQHYCTTDRSGDWLDFIANAIGCGIGTTIGLFIYPRQRQ